MSTSETSLTTVSTADRSRSGPLFPSDRQRVRRSQMFTSMSLLPIEMTDKTMTISCNKPE